jgi:hypothetical protein
MRSCLWWCVRCAPWLNRSERLTSGMMMNRPKKKIDVGTRWRTLWKKKIPSFRSTSVGRIALRTRQRARVDTASKHKATVWKIISQGEKKKKQTIGNESWRHIRRGGNIIAPRKKKTKIMCATLFEFRAFFLKLTISLAYHLFFCSFLVVFFLVLFYSVRLCSDFCPDTPPCFSVKSFRDYSLFFLNSSVYTLTYSACCIIFISWPFLLFSGWKDTKSAVYTDRITLPTYSTDSLSLSRCLYYVLIFDKRTGDRLHCGKTKRQTRAAVWERETIFFVLDGLRVISSLRDSDSTLNSSCIPIVSINEFHYYSLRSNNITF